jgi:hypothetical protein
MNLFHVNLWAILASAVSQWILGALWYGKVFSARWKVLVGYDSTTTKPKFAALGMVSSIMSCLVLSFALANLVEWVGADRYSQGISVGFIAWLGFIAPPMITQHIYENRPFKLFAINGGYWLFAMAFGGSILAVWH